MDANPIAFLAHLGSSPFITVREVGGCGQLVAPGAPAPFNAVYAMGWATGNIESRAREVRDVHTSQGLTALWWIGPSARPDALVPALEKLGLDRVPSTWLMRTGLTSEPSADVLVDEVRTQPDLEDWCTVYEATHQMAAAQAAFCRAVYSSLLTAQSPLTHFVVREEGVPVAVASIFLHGDHAGVYNVATVQRARGRGLASAVTSGALRHAYRQGYRNAMLGSEEAAMGIYRRLGFQPCGELIRMLAPVETP
jgi:ribosomal protein S18 acetylase RimI-like enzyme